MHSDTTRLRPYHCAQPGRLRHAPLPLPYITKPSTVKGTANAALNSVVQHSCSQYGPTGTPAAQNAFQEPWRMGRLSFMGRSVGRDLVDNGGL